MTNVAVMATSYPRWATAQRRVSGDDASSPDGDNVGNSVIGIELIGYEERGLAERLGGDRLGNDAVTRVDRARIAMGHTTDTPTAVSVTILEGPGANGS